VSIETNRTSFTAPVAVGSTKIPHLDSDVHSFAASVAFNASFTPAPSSSKLQFDAFRRVESRDVVQSDRRQTC
jgi:hypothetical protein